MNQQLIQLAEKSGTISFNTIISNVPGIQQPIYLAGAEMVKMMGMGPVVDETGLFHAAFSYNGALSITFTACREMMTDPALYAECIQSSYDELKQAALSDPVESPKRSSRKKKAVKSAASNKRKKTVSKSSRKIPMKPRGKTAAKRR